MSDVTIARRYARALFELALERGQMAAVDEDLAALIKLIQENQDLKRFLADQLIGPERKKELVQTVLAGALSKTTLHFIMLVIDKRRERLLEVMYREFRSCINQSANILEGEVGSAVPLDREDLAQLEEKLSAAIKKKVLLTNRVEPALIGGLVVKLGDRVYDGSLRYRLTALKQKLRQTDFSQIGVTQSS
ncbi:MAG: F0F1 ATP synthase subunit delta [Bacillota bacterium]